MRLVGIIILFCAATMANSAPKGYMDPSTGALFPEKLGKLTLQEVNPFENSDLGKRIAYSGHGARASVYIYNLGRSNIPHDIDSAEVRKEFEDAKNGIFQVDRWGKVDHLGDRIVTVETKSASLPMHRARFRFTKNGTASFSYLYLFCQSKHFVKVRLTCDLTESKCEARSEAFIQDLARRYKHRSREVIPRETYHRMVEDLINDPYSEHADGLRSILFVYADGIRPEFVVDLAQIGPLLDSDQEDLKNLWIQVAISSGDYLLAHPEAIENEYEYQLAGLEGALRLYEKMLEIRPDVHHEFLDGLIELRDAGRLGEHVRAHQEED